jgi:cell division inhibitor SepF
MKGNVMEKKFWWLSKKNEPASDFEEYNKGYYGEELAEVASSTSESAYDTDASDVSVVLSGDPSKEKPLLKRIFTPLTCNDSSEIVDAFKDGRIAVICIEELDKPNFTRLFDYLMGAVQALDGELRRLDRDTVALLPYGVDSEISLDEIEEEIVEEDEAVEDDEDID